VGVGRLEGCYERRAGGNDRRAVGQHRHSGPWRTEHQEIMVGTPAYHFASPAPLELPMNTLLNLLVKLLNQYMAIS
jgi:hypothetical protein